MDGQDFALYTENGTVKVGHTRFAQHGKQLLDSNLTLIAFDIDIGLKYIDTRSGCFGIF